ncbi:MAG: zinc ribbon domain-containing protein [Candidatus Lokiarchaeota archaeon]|jgi:hypothetical protein
MIYCPNCGVKLTNSNQKFCHNCRFNLVKSGAYLRQYCKEINLKEFGLLGSYSKNALVYSIISFGLVILGLIQGSLRGIFFIVGYSSREELNLLKVALIVNTIINGTGLAFGIWGSINGKNARLAEPRNQMEIIGRALSILRIIFNGNIFLFVAFLDPFILRMPYFIPY